MAAMQLLWGWLPQRLQASSGRSSRLVTVRLPSGSSSPDLGRHNGVRLPGLDDADGKESVLPGVERGNLC